jgi:hypothetical protein
VTAHAVVPTAATKNAADKSHVGLRTKRGKLDTDPVQVQFDLVKHAINGTRNEDEDENDWRTASAAHEEIAAVLKEATMIRADATRRFTAATDKGAALTENAEAAVSQASVDHDVALGAAEKTNTGVINKRTLRAAALPPDRTAVWRKPPPSHPRGHAPSFAAAVSAFIVIAVAEAVGEDLHCSGGGGIVASTILLWMCAGGAMGQLTVAEFRLAKWGKQEVEFELLEPSRALAPPLPPRTSLDARAH